MTLSKADEERLNQGLQSLRDLGKEGLDAELEIQFAYLMKKYLWFVAEKEGVDTTLKVIEQAKKGIRDELDGKVSADELNRLARKGEGYNRWIEDL